MIEVNHDTQHVDLEDEFSLDEGSSKLFRLKLSPNALNLQKLNGGATANTQTFLIDDLFGCLCMKGKRHPSTCCLILYFFAVHKPISDGKIKMSRFEKTLFYAKFDDFQQNFQQMKRWYDAIHQAMYLRRRLPRKCERHSTVNENRWPYDIIFVVVVDIITTKREKPALVFVNPAGGAGKAYRLVMEYVVGVWSEAEFAHQIIITGEERQRNASRAMINGSSSL
jgi:hypothetical protein